MPKILFIAIHRPDRSPSQRFRFEQYLDFLEKNGWDYEFSYLISEKDDKYLYQKGFVLMKAFILIKAIFTRLKDVYNASNFDMIFIQREAFFTGTTFFEKRFSKSKAKLVFDFDDSIWLPNVSEGNKKLLWLKNGGKTKNIISYSDLIFAGNKYLADYASEFNDNVVIVPTTIDLNYHKVKSVTDSKTITIGWTGTSTTLPYLENILSVLERLKEKYSDTIDFKIIVDVEKEYKSIGAKTTLWTRDEEVEELSKIDVGIMPLPDTQWTRGKCGFKGLQYMALEIPTVMSPVGVNCDIVNNGKNGFLADTDEEWFEVISNLIDSLELRKNLGIEAKKTIQEYYSVSSQENVYLAEFEKLIQSK